MKRLKRGLSVAAFVFCWPAIVGLFILGWAMVSPEDRARWRQRILGPKRRVIFLVEVQRT